MKTTSPWFDSVSNQQHFGALQGEIATDVVVVGGGIVGLLTAWRLAEQGASVVLLQKHNLADGDTGYTTAFVSRMPDASIAKLNRRFGSDFVKQLFQANRSAQDALRELVTAEQISCDWLDCPSYFVSYQANDPLLASEWQALRQVEPLASQAHQAIKLDSEARFDVRKFLFNLISRADAKKIRFYEQSEVVSFEIGDQVVAKTPSGSVKAKKIILTTGLPPLFAPELRKLVTPVVTFALAASYQDSPPFADALYWDTDEPYQYYRWLDNRTIILGGADRKVGERPQVGEPTPHEKLKTFLNERYPGSYEVTHQWSGTIFETADSLPYIGITPGYSEKLLAATGFDGNGMVMGTLAAMILADLAMGKPNPHARLFRFDRAASFGSTQR